MLSVALDGALSDLTKLTWLCQNGTPCHISDVLSSLKESQRGNIT